MTALDPWLAENDDTGVDIYTAAYTVFNTTVDTANDRNVRVVARLSSLDGAVGDKTTLKTTVGGYAHTRGEQVNVNAVGASSIQLETQPIVVYANETLTVTVQSDNSSDTSVDFEIKILGVGEEVVDTLRRKTFTSEDVDSGGMALYRTINAFDGGADQTLTLQRLVVDGSHANGAVYIGNSSAEGINVDSVGSALRLRSSCACGAIDIDNDTGTGIDICSSLPGICIGSSTDGVNIFAGASGVLIDANTASYAGLYVCNGSGPAAVFSSPNCAGIEVYGHTKGVHIEATDTCATGIDVCAICCGSLGLRVRGCADGAYISAAGHGVYIDGASTGALVTSSGGHGIEARATGQDGSGIYAHGCGNGAGICVHGGATGVGVNVIALGGDAVFLGTSDGSASALHLCSDSTGGAMDITNGAGPGVCVNADSSTGAIDINNTSSASGAGIDICTNNGHGICVRSGCSAIYLNGASSGIEIEAAGDGVFVSAGNSGAFICGMLSGMDLRSNGGPGICISSGGAAAAYIYGQADFGLHVCGACGSAHFEGGNGPGVLITSQYEEGVCIDAASGVGVKITSSGSTGVDITGANRGIDVSATNDALYLHSDCSAGVVVNSTCGDGIAITARNTGLDICSGPGIAIKAHSVANNAVYLSTADIGVDAIEVAAAGGGVLINAAGGPGVDICGATNGVNIRGQAHGLFLYGQGCAGLTACGYHGADIKGYERGLVVNAACGTGAVVDGHTCGLYITASCGDAVHIETTCATATALTVDGAGRGISVSAAGGPAVEFIAEANNCAAFRMVGHGVGAGMQVYSPGGAGMRVESGVNGAMFLSGVNSVYVENALCNIPDNKPIVDGAGVTEVNVVEWCGCVTGGYWNAGGGYMMPFTCGEATITGTVDANVVEWLGCGVCGYWNGSYMLPDVFASDGQIDANVTRWCGCLVGGYWDGVAMLPFTCGEATVSGTVDANVVCWLGCGVCGNYDAPYMYPVIDSVTGDVGGGVTGAVGSVTGNVGGNVVGSVGSVTTMVDANVCEWLSAAAQGSGGVPEVNVVEWCGCVTGGHWNAGEGYIMPFTCGEATVSGTVDANVVEWLGCTAQGSSGYPSVDAAYWGGAAVEGTGGFPDVNVACWCGTAVADKPEANVVEWNGCVVDGYWTGAAVLPKTCAGVTVPGVVDANVVCWKGCTAAGTNGIPATNAIQWCGTAAELDGGYPKVAATGAAVSTNVTQWAGQNVGVWCGLPCVAACAGGGGCSPCPGDGSVSVNHNYGGTDNLSYIVDDGEAVDEAIVQAFLSTDYAAGRRSRNYVKGETKTNVRGRWVTEMRLDPGLYTIVFYKQGEYGPDTATVTVTS